MDCATATCPPISTGWSALVLWIVTFYGVLLFLSVFVTIVHRQAPTLTGGKILRILALGNGLGLAAAPILLIGLFDQPLAAAGLMIVQLALALLCRRLAAHEPLDAEAPRARARRGILRPSPGEDR